jgi:hypothetical protein
LSLIDAFRAVMLVCCQGKKGTKVAHGCAVKRHTHQEGEGERERERERERQRERERERERKREREREMRATKDLFGVGGHLQHESTPYN